jgi:photosystem II stability/assembly factor-like uncharacterized protein
MLFVANKEGVYTARKSGRNGWKMEGPALSGKTLMCLETDASGRTLYVGLYKEGVLRSSDEGRSWEEITSNLPHKDVRALAVSPENPDVIYVGTEPAALFISRNGGRSWSESRQLRELPQAKEWSFPVRPRIAHVRTIEIDARNPRTVYAGIEVGSFLKSEDGGESWKVLDGLGHDIHRALISPEDPKRIYVATGLDTAPYKGGFGLYRSDDGGGSWRQANAGLGKRLYVEDAVSFHTADPKVMFLAAADGIPPHWAAITNMVFGVMTGNVYFWTPSRLRRRKGADVAIYRSRDAGERWEPVGDGLPESFFDMVWALDSGPTESGTCGVYFGTTGGDVYASEDGGDSWKKIAAGLGNITHVKVVPE